MIANNVDFPLDFVKIETQINQAMEIPPDAPSLAAVKVQIQRKTLSDYELKMRSYAERCLAGR